MKKLTKLLLPLVLMTFFIVGILVLKPTTKIFGASDVNCKSVYFTKDSTDFTKIEEITLTQTSQTFAIGVEGDTGNTYDIRFKTYDGTLIASAGDYTKIDGSRSVTIAPSDDNQGLSQNVYLTVDSSVFNYVTANTENYFFVKIVTVNGYSQDDAVLKVNVKNNYNYETQKNSTESNGEEFKLYSNKIATNDLITSKVTVKNHKASLEKIVPLSNTYSLSEKNLINAGIANYFVGIDGYISWASSYSEPTLAEYNLYDSNGEIIRKTAYATNSSFSYEWVTPGEQDSKNDKWENADDTFNVSFTKWKDRTLIGKTRDNQESYFESGKGNICFYKITNGANSEVNPYISLTNYCKAQTYTLDGGSVDRDSLPTNGLDLKDWKSYSFIADTTAPVVENVYVLDEMNNVSSNDTIKVAVRFSEPVQVLSKDKLSINLLTNTTNRAQAINKLNYTYGTGTNTLVFSLKGSDVLDTNFGITEFNCSQITGVTINGKNSIRDYSSNLYTASNEDEGYFSHDKETTTITLSSSDSETSLKVIDFIVDLRTPETKVITKVDGVKGGYKISKSKDFHVAIENVSSGYTFAYKIIPLSELKDKGVDNYLYDTDLIETKDKSTIIFSEEDKSGYYYIYWKTTSYYGKSISNIEELKEQANGLLDGSIKENSQSYLLKYDNTIPEIYTYDDSSNKVNDSFIAEHPVKEDGGLDYEKYTFTFYMEDLPYAVDDPLDNIEEICLVYSKDDLNLMGSIYTLAVYINSEKHKDYNFTQDSTDKTKFSFTISKQDLIDNAGDAFDSDYIVVDCGISILDIAGNMYDISSATRIVDKEVEITDDFGNKTTQIIQELEGEFAHKTLTFDSRTQLEGDGEYDGDLINSSLEAYNVGTKLTYTVSSSEITSEGSIFRVNIKKLTYDRINRYSHEEDIVTYPSEEANYNKDLYGITLSGYTYTIEFKNPGYYEVVFDVDGAKFSETYKIYISNGGNDATYNTLNNQMIINDVYAIEDVKYYYYNGKSIQTENYNYTSKAQMFSTKDLLISYIKYYEYKDLTAEVITNAQAAQLNNGSSSTFKLASGESHTAKSGQIYIKYKRSDWNFSSNVDDWVYYYYGESASQVIINTQNLSPNLKAAINSVVTTIEGKSKKVNLVTDEYLVNGVPTLSSDQIHPDAESSKESFSGTNLRNVNFEGDATILKSSIEYDKKTFYFYSNYEIDYSAYTKIYYKPYNTETAYRELKVSTSGIPLNQLLLTGYYELVEIDEYGMSTTLIYIVSQEDAPQIEVTYTSSIGTLTEDTWTYEIDGSKFNVRSFSINSILNTNDEYAYVLVYKTNNSSSYKTYYQKDFKNSDSSIKALDFEDGNYTVVVSDRFGNSYSFIVSLNSSAINCSVTNRDNEYIRFRCDLLSSNVFRFIVKLNGEVIETKYSDNIVYRKTGLYEFYVEDVYGNTDSVSIELNRKLPEVSWYYNDNGKYVLYDSSIDNVKINEISSNTFEIITKSQLQFRYELDLGYEIEGDASCDSTTFNGITRVTIENAKSFRLKVYYNDYTEAYVNYIVTFDDIIPTIIAKTNSSEYSYLDIANIKEKNYNITSIGYASKSETDYILVNGQEIYTGIINLNVSDQSALKYLRVLLNDKELYLSEEINEEYSFDLTAIALEKGYDIYGTYKITAIDLLGNEAYLEFTNKKPDYYEISIDGNIKALEQDPSVGISKENYGHDTVIYKFKNISDLTLFIDNIYLNYSIANSSLIRSYVKTSIVYNEETHKDEEKKELIIDTLNISTDWQDDSFVISGLKISYKTDETYYYVSIKATDNNEHSILSRVISEYSIFPFYSYALLYQQKSEITFKDSDGLLNTYNYIVYTNKEFVIDLASLDPNIEKILWGYNDTNQNFELTELTTDTNNFGEYDGYYKFIVTNKYGNITEYIVVVSREFLVETNVIHKDSTEFSYTNVNDATYYSNGSVWIKIYKKEYTATISKDGKEYTPQIDNSNDLFDLIVFNEFGEYDIYIEDNSGNQKNIKISLKNKAWELNDAILKGFNEDALKKDELYTNKRLTIDSSYFITQNVFFITITYNDEERIVYDNLSQAKITNIDLKDIIGYNGDGVYTIKFRNEYGEIVEKNVNYRGTDTLSILRMTRSETQYTKVDIKDIYSNNKVKFETEASLYQFIIDNNNHDCPYELAFPYATSNGKFEYKVYYLDEYGFKYDFYVYLQRQQITYNLSGETTEVNGTLSIRENFKVDFNSEYSASYELNDKTYSYKAGTELTKDGKYKISIYDKAGNSTKLTIKKDTIVSYEVVENYSSRVLVNGDISNVGEVLIQSLDDDKVSVYKAYLNGDEQTSIPSRYTRNGKWELLLKDQYGNETYFCFYIYTQAISSFEYTTPYNYHISQIMQKDKDGELKNYIDTVVQNNNNSYVKLSEDGNYYIEMLSSATNETIAFEINIDNVAPKVSLVGVENGGKTNKNIKLSGYKEGDIIKIYKDGSLSKTINVTSDTMASPVISEMGDYKIEIINTVGNTTTLEFRRTYTANTASSVFVCVVLVAVATGLFIGLYSRKREKID